MTLHQFIILLLLNYAAAIFDVCGIISARDHGHHFLTAWFWVLLLINSATLLWLIRQETA